MVPIVALAVLTRPNLAPLGLPLAVFGLLANRSGRQRVTTGRCAAGVVAGLACGAAIAAYTNTVLYGAPQSTGYGDPASLYSLRFLWPNLQRYSGWLWRHRKLSDSAGGGRNRAVGVRRRISATVGGVRGRRGGHHPSLVSFLHPVRRLDVPAVPASRASADLHRIYVCRRSDPILVVGLSVALLAFTFISIGRWACSRHISASGDTSRCRATSMRCCRQNAVFITQQHSGSIRYYTGRKTLRFDWLPASRARQRRQADEPVWATSRTSCWTIGKSPSSKTRFGRSALARLDWWPTAEFATQIRVRIYDPAAR